MKHPSFTSAHISIYTLFPKQWQQIWETLPLREGTMRLGCYLFIFHFQVYNNPVLQAKQSLLEALRHIKFIPSTAQRWGTVFQHRNTNIQDSAGEK